MRVAQLTLRRGACRHELSDVLLQRSVLVNDEPQLGERRRQLLLAHANLGRQPLGLLLCCREPLFARICQLCEPLYLQSEPLLLLLCMLLCCP